MPAGEAFTCGSLARARRSARAGAEIGLPRLTAPRAQMPVRMPVNRCRNPHSQRHPSTTPKIHDDSATDGTQGSATTPLFQKLIGSTSIEAVGLETSFETTPPAFIAVQAGWVGLSLVVSKVESKVGAFNPCESPAFSQAVSHLRSPEPRIQISPYVGSL